MVADSSAPKGPNISAQGNALVAIHISTPAMLAIFGHTKNAKASGEKTAVFSGSIDPTYQRVHEGDSTLVRGDLVN